MVSCDPGGHCFILGEVVETQAFNRNMFLKMASAASPFSAPNVKIRHFHTSLKNGNTTSIGKGGAVAGKMSPTQNITNKKTLGSSNIE